MRIEVINNARNEKKVLDFYNDVEAFEYIHKRVLADDQAHDEFEANGFGDPIELTLEEFVDDFGSSISVGDYTYRFID